jgi:hypothetical protein
LASVATETLLRTMRELAIDSDANETLLAIRIRFVIKDRVEVEERSGTLNELLQESKEEIERETEREGRRESERR